MRPVQLAATLTVDPVDKPPQIVPSPVVAAARRSRMRSRYDRTATLRAVSLTLTLALAASVVLWAVARGDTQRRVLFFPEFHSQLLEGEVRYLPRRESLAEAARLLIEEAILGPANHEAVAVVPRTAEVLSVHVIGEEAIINLSQHVLFDPTPLAWSRLQRLQGLANTILYNLRELSTVRLLVEGEEPRFEGAANGRLQFAKSLLR